VVGKEKKGKKCAQGSPHGKGRGEARERPQCEDKNYPSQAKVAKSIDTSGPIRQMGIPSIVPINAKKDIKKNQAMGKDRGVRQRDRRSVVNWKKRACSVMFQGKGPKRRDLETQKRSSLKSKTNEETPSGSGRGIRK